MKTTLRAIQILGTAVLTISAMTAWAQSTTSVMIPLNKESFEKLPGEDLARLNLVKEAQKVNPALAAAAALEVQLIRVDAKSGIGGAQVFLRVNNEMMDSRVIETDPDQLNSTEATTFQRVELKNIDRATVKEASLVIQSFSNTRIRSLELVLGAVQEPVIFGHYADAQIGNIGGGAPAADSGKVLKPSPATLNSIYNRYYLGSKNGAVTASPATPLGKTTPIAMAVPTPAQAPMAVAAPTIGKNCVLHAKGYSVCVGDTVKNQWDYPGQVLAVNVQSRIISAQFEYSNEPLVRNVDTFKK